MFFKVLIFGRKGGQWFLQGKIILARTQQAAKRRWFLAGVR